MKKSEIPESVEVPTWVKRGSMLVRRSALGPNDPESEYNYIKNNYPGVDPLLYGAEAPKERCAHCGSYKPDEDEF